MDEKYLYMVCLNRTRIFVIAVLFMGMFSLFFIAGLAVGMHATENETLVRNDLTGESLPSEVSAPVGGEQKIVSRVLTDERGKGFVSEESGLKKPTPPSSFRLLEKDLASVPIAVVKNSPRTLPHRPNTRLSTTGEKIDPKYYIQLFVTSQKTRADHILNELLKRKYKGYLRHYSREGRTTYTVRVGLYRDKELALKDLEMLKTKGGFKDAFLKLNLPSRPSS